MAIPKIIFQTWKTQDLPDNFAYWAKTFRDKNPSYTYRMWTDADNRAFIEDKYPWFLATYDAFPAEIYRADAVRYFFLLTYGGIYSDLDTECLSSLDDILQQGDVVLGRMGTDASFEHSIPNAFMASAPGQEFWLLVISLMMQMAETHNTARPEYVTGPVILKKAYDLYTTQYGEDFVQMRMAKVRSAVGENVLATKSRVVAMPGIVFFPIDWSDRVHDELFRKPLLRDRTLLSPEQAKQFFPRSLTVSYWAHSWEAQ